MLLIYISYVMDFPSFSWNANAIHTKAPLSVEINTKAPLSVAINTKAPEKFYISNVLVHSVVCV
jgi:hypothetical protein